MIEVVISEVVTLSDGVVELSKRQAARRAHLLERIRDDMYRIVLPVQFKAGERIGIDAIPKHLESVLVVEKQKPAARQADHGKA